MQEKTLENKAQWKFQSAFRRKRSKHWKKSPSRKDLPLKALLEKSTSRQGLRQDLSQEEAKELAPEKTEIEKRLGGDNFRSRFGGLKLKI